MSPHALSRRGSLLCVLALLCCAREVRAQVPVVSAESSVGALVTAPQPLAGSPPAVAFDGTQYLVVWATYSPRGIQAVRVLPDGTVLDAAGLAIAFPSDGSVNVEAPAVAFNGTHFVVVWSAYLGVQAARIARDGTVLDPGGFQVSDFSGPEGSPAVACGQGGCLVAWRHGGDESGPGPLLGRRLRADGSSPDARDLTLGTRAGPASLAAAYGFFLVAWTYYLEDGWADIRARLIPWGEQPVPWEEAFVPVSTAALGQYRPHVSRWEEGWLIVWDDGRQGASGIYGARMDASGAILDVDGVPLATGPEGRTFAQADYDGTRWLVTWVEQGPAGQRIRGTRVAGDLSVLDPGGLTLSDARLPMLRAPAVAHGAGGFLVTYAASRELFGRVGEFILGTRVDAGGTVLDSPSRGLSCAAATQQRPAVARGDGVDLAVWAEYRHFEGPTLFGARIGADGRREGAELVLPSAPGSRNPAVAFDGSRYLVVWEEPAADGTTDLRGARVSATGRLLDTTSLAISTAPGDQRRPAVTFAAGRLWVVWEDARHVASGGGRAIYGARVRYFGEVVDPQGLRLSLSPGEHRAPAAAALGEELLVAWEEVRPGSGVDIRGTRVRWNGAVVSPEGVTFSGASGEQRAPAMASAGAQVLLVWEDARPGLPATQIHGTRVDAWGQPRDVSGLPISTQPRRHSAPSVSFDGQRYWVAWEDRRRFTSFPAADLPDLYAARVGTDGGVVDPGGLVLSRRAEGEFSPVLVSHGEGRSKVYSTRFVEKAGVHATRIKSRFIDTPP